MTSLQTMNIRMNVSLKLLKESSRNLDVSAKNLNLLTSTGVFVHNPSETTYFFRTSNFFSTLKTFSIDIQIAHTQESA